MKKLTSFIFASLLLGATTLMASGTLKETTGVMSNGKRVGEITVLTPVEITGKTEVKVKGYRLESYPQQIVRDMKRGEIYVEFDEELEDLAMKAFKVLSEKEDDYGEIWQEVEGTITIDKASALTKDAAPLYKKAKTTYEQSCSMCHHLPDPHHYTVNQWPQQIEMMMEQIPLEKPIKSLVTKYLQHNAADAK